MWILWGFHCPCTFGFSLVQGSENQQVGWNFHKWELLRKFSWASSGAALSSVVPLKAALGSRWFLGKKIPASRMRQVGKWDQPGASPLRVHYWAGYRLGKQSPIPQGWYKMWLRRTGDWLRISPAPLRAPSSRLHLHVAWADFLSFRESPDPGNGQRTAHHHCQKLERGPRSCDVGHKKSLLCGARDPGCSLSRKDTGVRRVGDGGAFALWASSEHDQATGKREMALI